jgi:hypothetical protein
MCWSVYLSIGIVIMTYWRHDLMIWVCYWHWIRWQLKLDKLEDSFWHIPARWLVTDIHHHKLESVQYTDSWIQRAPKSMFDRHCLSDTRIIWTYRVSHKFWGATRWLFLHIEDSVWTICFYISLKYSSRALEWYTFD